MIKNQRQYKLTQGAIASFEEAIAAWDSSACPEGVAPEMYELQLAGLKSQLETLIQEREEYEALLDGRIDQIPLGSLHDLPTGLIKARIARGMTQRQLADAMGLKQQQVQRWEHEDYEGVSFANLLGVAHALKVRVSECIELPRAPRPALSELRERGISKSFVLARLVPRAAQRYLAEAGKGSDRELLAAASDRLERVFGLHVQTDGTLAVNDDRFVLAAAGGRFKLPANADSSKVKAYAVYASHLGSLVGKATAHLPVTPLPSGWSELRAALCGEQPPSFEVLLRGAWRHGVPVLPLADPVRFHGFCLSTGGRHVIIIKQSLRQQSRWAFDLLHELAHAVDGAQRGGFDLLDEDAAAQERRESEEEVMANELAGAVLLEGRASTLFEIAYAAARNAGGLFHLKKIARDMAETEHLDLGYLANYFAFRLRNDYFEEWWGPATSLQPEGADPFVVARDVFFEHADLSALQADDKDMLLQALDLHA